MNECGGPIIDAVAIEQRLRDLWKDEAGPGEAGDSQAVMRAGVMNLVVYAPGEGAEDSVVQSVGFLTRSHPGRVILLIPFECGELSGEGGALDTQVSTLCNSLCCGKQVCGELIVIRCPTGQLRYLPSLVQPLLEADLPRVLWWRDDPAFGAPLFNQLADTVDRLVVDTSPSESTAAGLSGLAGRILRTRKAVVADLAWSRLEAWRTAIAGIFDVERHAALIPGIRRIEIVFERREARGELSSPAVMASGWLATRIGLRIAGPLTPAGNGDFELPLAGAEGGSVISLRGRDEGMFLGGLESIRLLAPDAEFRVECSDAGHLAAFAGEGWGPWFFQVPEEGEAQVVSRELDTHARDPIYEETMRFIAGMELQ